jgi:iron complex outermembrane receptor protein
MSKTTLAGGLVLDHTETPETGGRTPGQEPLDKMGWRAGLSHTVNTDWKLHASASQRSRFPALRELYSGSLNRFRPNPDLKPETLLGFEAGATVSRAWGGGAIDNGTFSVTGFKHTVDDAVVRITLTSPTRFMRVNRDRIESSGAEILGGLTFGPDREKAVTLNFDALVQRITIYDITTEGEPSRHAENNPEKRGALELGVPLPAQLRAFANARYTGTQYCVNPAGGADLELEAQTESDIGVERRFTLTRGLFRSVRALLAVDNLRNATVFDSCGLPQPGRTLRVMFTVR